MATKSAPASAPIKTVDSQIPIGGNPAKVDSPALEPDEISWDDGSAKASSVADANTSTINTEGNSRDSVTPETKAKIDALLGRGKVPEGVTLTAEGSPSVLQPGDKPSKAAASETSVDTPATGRALRRDLLSTAREAKGKLDLEKSLSAERARADAAEKALKETDIRDLARSRGMTEEQVLEYFVRNPGKDPATIDPVAALAKRVDGIDTDIKTREQAVKAREQAIANKQAEDFIAEEIKSLDVPLVKATKAWPIADDKGVYHMHSGISMVLKAADRLWQDAGSVQGTQRQFIKMAAEASEELLDNDTKPTVDAAITKRGGSVTPKTETTITTKTESRPSVGKGGGGATRDSKTAVSDDLPTDRVERREAIKRRFANLP